MMQRHCDARCALLRWGFPMFRGLDVERVTTYSPPTATWDFIKRVRDESSM